MATLFHSDPSFLLTQWLFLKLMGVIYLLAFTSLWRQVQGLYGSRGILPIYAHISLLRSYLGYQGFRSYPSLFWLGCSDRLLNLTALTGMFCATLLIVGVWPPLMLGLLWLLYLSYMTVGQDFLSFQWDTLLLEAGFMSFFFALVTPPTLLMMIAFWFFLARFIFSSGVVKLTSHDPNWRQLTAMCFHYETQPLPNRVGYYLHHQPLMLQKISTLSTFFFELLIPVLFITPEPLRLFGFIGIVFFQGLILSSGNYGFFNLLTIVLAILMLKGDHLSLLTSIGTSPMPTTSPAPWAALMSLLFVIFLALNALQLLALFAPQHRLLKTLRQLAPFMITNSYGLFAVMTTNRFEFDIQGSHDQQTWHSYTFKWKPGDPKTMPRQVAPHQPRLDWQMWFAALQPANVEPWLYLLLQRLVEGSASVTALFRHNPFADQPPSYVRLVLYQYHFSELKTKQANGDWWQRTLLGEYPAMSLDDLRKITGDTTVAAK